MPRRHRSRSRSRTPASESGTEYQGFSPTNSNRSDETGYTYRSSTSSGHTYDTTPEGARFPQESDDETIREEGEVHSDVEDDFIFGNLPIFHRWEDSDDSGDEGARRDRRNGRYSPRTPDGHPQNQDHSPEHYIEDQNEEIRNLKRRLEDAKRERNRAEYEYRQQYRAKRLLQREVRRLDNGNERKRKTISELDDHIKMLEEDNKVLVEENNCLADVSQQYYHSKEQERRTRKRATRHLEKKKRECATLKSDMRIVKDREGNARALDAERERANNYRKLMLDMSAVLSSEAQNPGEDPPTWKTCEICVRQYTADRDLAPRILIGCGHTVCHSCVNNLQAQEQEEDGVRCPFDRTLTIFPDGSPNSLPKNYALLRM